MGNEDLRRLIQVISEPRYVVRDRDVFFFHGLSELAIDSIFHLWSQIATHQRTTIVSRLVGISRENMDLEFTSLFKRCTQDASPDVRERAIAGLWESEDRGIVPLLLTCLSADPDPRVRISAALELGRFVTLAEEGKLLERDREALYEGLMRALTSAKEIPLVRRRSLESVSAFSSTDVDKWITWAYKQGDDFHQSALYAMGRTCDAKWLSWVLEDLNSIDPSIRCEAINACREIGDYSCVPKLLPLLEDEESEVQIAAIWALASIGGDQVRSYLQHVSNTADDSEIVEVIQTALTMSDLDDISVSAGDPSLEFDNQN